MTTEELAHQIMAEGPRHLLPLRGPEPGIEDRWKACEWLVRNGLARWFERTTPYWPGVEISASRSKS